MYELNLSRPMKSSRKAWIDALGGADVRKRWHDLRHSTTEQTIRGLAGHVSRRLLERYSHIRSQAKQGAMRVLEERGTNPNLDMTGHRNGLG